MTRSRAAPEGVTVPGWRCSRRIRIRKQSAGAMEQPIAPSHKCEGLVAVRGWPHQAGATHRTWTWTRRSQTSPTIRLGNGTFFIGRASPELGSLASEAQWQRDNGRARGIPRRFGRQRWRTGSSTRFPYRAPEVKNSPEDPFQLCCGNVPFGAGCILLIAAQCAPLI